MRTKHSKQLLTALTIALLAAGTGSSRAATIAHWKFEIDNLAGDSSGNGFDLSVSSLNSSSDKDPRAPGNGSGAFSSTIAQSGMDLDLSPYQGVTFEWFMKSSQPGNALGVIFELSPNFNGTPGAGVVYINESAPDQFVWGNFTSRGYSIISDTYPTDGQWHHYAVTIDTTRTDAQRQKIFIDGIDVSATGGVLGGTQPEPLGVHPLFIGSRAGGNFFLNALIDEFRISDQVLEPDQFLAPVTYPNAALTVSKEPADASADENRVLNGGQPVTFEAGLTVDNAPPSAVRYQWQSLAPGAGTWTDIPGATTASLPVSELTRSANGTKYRLTARVIGSPATATTREALLTIVNDDVRPAIVSVGAIAGSVGVCFSEGIDPVTAGNASNYQVAGANISGVEVQPDGRSVKLLLDADVTGPFTVTVATVADLAGNTVAAGTQANGEPLNLAMLDIAPELAPVFQPGTAFSCEAGAVRVAAGGSDIWAAADSFQFLYQLRQGDFDVMVQVPKMQAAGFYARGGLMARESLSPDSRNVIVTVYPTRGVFLPHARFDTGGNSDVVGSIVGFDAVGAAYPNVWLRLKRQGDTFRMFGSRDGQNWVSLGSYTPSAPYPAELYVGLGTTAQNDSPGVVADAEYKHFGEVAVGEAIITVLSQPANLSRPEGAPASFGVSVDVAGVPAGELTYQWQRNQENIPGATSSTLNLSAVTMDDNNAKFRVVLRAGTKEVISSEATLAVTANPHLARRAIQAIAVINEATKTLNNRGDESVAVDGDIATWSYLTPSGTASPQLIALDLGETPMLVNRLRLAKIGNDDGADGRDRMDLEILYTASTGQVENRVWQRVSGLVNGYYGGELVQAAAVNADGTVDNEEHDFAAHGWFALTFDAARATAIAIRVARDSADPFPFTHYPAYEIELYNDVDFGDATITFSQQPQNLAVSEFGSAIFAAQASAPGVPASALAYQWKRNGIDIPGATGPTLVLPEVTRDDQNARYLLVASLGANSATSDEATLTIQLDQTPPQVVSASSVDGNSIGVCFNETLGAVSAELAGNYAVQGGEVTSAVLQPDGRTVLLSVTGVSGSAFSLRVQAVQDRAGNPMPSTDVTGQVQGLTILDIAPELAPVFQPGAVISCAPGEFEVKAGGLDVYGSQDSFNFIYQQVTGDFDLRVKVERMDTPQFYARGGLMVRENITSGSRNIHVVAYPTRNEFLTTIRREDSAASDVLGSVVAWNPLGVAYPNVWVRLRREGNTFRTYGSKDGASWTLLGTETPANPYPDSVLVGLATTAQRDEPGFFVDAKYSNYGTNPFLPITITADPVGGTRYLGGTYRFQVAFTGTDPWQIQWLHNGEEIQGATGPVLSLRDLTADDAGEYRARVSNSAGAKLSAPAQLEVLQPNVTTEKLPITDIEVFVADTKALDNRGDESRAIDGDINTETYLTPSSSVSPHVAALDLGALKQVNRLRVSKGSNTDGTGSVVDNMDLEVWYTTDTGPLNERNYQRVSGLGSGFLLEEVINATAVNPDGTVDNDRHHSANNGPYSLTFNTVQATAIALRIARDPNDERPFTHYLVYEMELYLDDAGGTSPELNIALDGSQLVITWPVAGSDGFALQASPAVGPGAEWNPAQATVTEAGGTRQARLTIDAATRFFRLVR